VWRTAHVHRKVKDIEVGAQNEEGLTIKVFYELTDINVPYTVEYLIQNNGTLQVTASIDMTDRELPELPRFAMRMEMPAQYENLQYYGRGPRENCSDRQFSALIGMHSDEVASQFTANYIRPQEDG